MTALPETTALETGLEKGWLTIWFNLPESRNALSAELTADLRAVLDAVREDRGVRGITLRGRGGVFCAGGDLKAFSAGFGAEGDAARAAIVDMSKSGAAIFDTVNSMPQVVIAVVEGAAMAGGLGLACCADVAIADAGAKFAFTETAIGLTPAQIAPFVIQKAGYATARRLMLTAACFKGAAAQTLGLVDFVADGAAALDELEAGIRQQVLGCAPGAVADIKQLILDLPTLDRSAQIAAAAENFAGRLLSEEGQEGVLSFIEKRKPSWAEED
ncbi:enoyl-CoA hydratase-related protein [Hyphobacterium sp. HN65]|uniref:Enoyl-CoA hydratase-related protein n=1 Tax=Hyphobacterium lacteum TaxID=3116575 RepID=A0ABU7LS87_9PROT|nr:enoyl-CoA hydratase-related protein [Hyphobacterium sp. HN65]MEE2526782.1 enoyl-CoA hydratase-related protein [Hyphobacterium sp. HN65]